jgi:acetone carboxylase gamma subunit
MNDDELLHKLYYKDLTFGGVQNLYKKAKQAHPKITLKIVEEWLNKQQSAQLNNKPVIKHDFKPIYSELPYAFQIDLTFFPRYKKQNEGNYVLFTAININTRFGYAYYGKDKESETIINFIKDLEKKTEINVLEGDLGNEFNNYELKKYCDNNNIILDLFKSDTHKMGIINRFHRTIKEKLSAYFDAFDTVKWIDIIDKIIDNYNHSVNRGIGYKPIDVNDFIENKIRQEKKAQGLKVEYEDFKVGQYVRVLNERGTYDDKMKSKYSDKIFTIEKVKNNSVEIRDEKGDLYRARKNEIKTVVKPDNQKELTAKKQATVDSKQEKIMKKEDINENNILRRSTRERKANTKYM